MLLIFSSYFFKRFAWTFFCLATKEPFDFAKDKSKKAFSLAIIVYQPNNSDIFQWRIIELVTTHSSIKTMKYTFEGECGAVSWISYITYRSLSLYPVLRQTDIRDVTIGLRCILLDWWLELLDQLLHILFVGLSLLFFIQNNQMKSYYIHPYHTHRFLVRSTRRIHLFQHPKPSCCISYNRACPPLLCCLFRQDG